MCRGRPTSSGCRRRRCSASRSRPAGCCRARCRWTPTRSSSRRPPPRAAPTRRCSGCGTWHPPRRLRTCPNRRFDSLFAVPCFALNVVSDPGCHLYQLAALQHQRVDRRHCGRRRRVSADSSLSSLHIRTQSTMWTSFRACCRACTRAESRGPWSPWAHSGALRSLGLGSSLLSVVRRRSIAVLLSVPQLRLVHAGCRQGCSWISERGLVSRRRFAESEGTH